MGLATRGLRGTAVHGGRAGPSAPGTPGGTAAPGQGPAPPVPAVRLRAEPAQSRSIRGLPVRAKAVFPAGVAAANLLGFTTQNAARIELATDSSSLPRPIVGRETVVHTRRPEAWRSARRMRPSLDFLRNRGAASDLSPAVTVRKLLGYFGERGRFERLLRAAPSEPPRVCARCSAPLASSSAGRGRLSALRGSLNPLSRFEFGILAALAHAREWQAKECASRETV